LVIAALQHGVVFLSMPKTASTSIEEALRPIAQVWTGGEPRMKHLTYRAFERFFQPWFQRNGHRRDSYEVICMLREPISWLNSWWRYRSRQQLADPAHRDQFTGDVSFDEFASAYMRGEPGFASVGRQANFIRGSHREIGMDRMFRFEELDLAVSYFESMLGYSITLEHLNVSPKRSLELSPAVEDDLRVFLDPEFRLWELATGDQLSKSEQQPHGS
jgi:hypothetical protein